MAFSWDSDSRWHAESCPLVVVVVLLLGGIYSHSQAQAEDTAGLRHFIQRSGDRLLDGEQVFRFISFNIPNLHNIEDNMALAASSPWRWPNEFEIRDALQSVRQMGGTVVRMYVLSVVRAGSDAGAHVHVLGPGSFNEEAFLALDTVLKIANEEEVRVILPLVDNWHWWGGIEQYAGFRRKEPAAFWSDPEIIGDFKQTIHYVIHRKNRKTGVRYKDDKAILAWETGNELDSTPEWTRQIAAYIKELDPNHLVLDGYALHGVRQASLDDPNIDIVTTHHYPNPDRTMVADIHKAISATKGIKPYITGEFGFVETPVIEQVLDTVIASHASGALLWSLRYHNRDGGFYWHSEPLGFGRYKAYHWPGFPAGDAYDERNVLALVRRKAWAIRGLELPQRQPPNPPQLLPIPNVGHITWQGSAGASSYDIERAGSPDGPWGTVGKSVSDAAVQYRPLFCDTSAEPGQKYYYRVKARNEAGISKSSNHVGPVLVKYRHFVDEMADLSAIDCRQGTVQIVSANARGTGEDRHRLQGKEGASIVYQFPGTIRSAIAYTYQHQPAERLSFQVSVDGKQFVLCDSKIEKREIAQSDYTYLCPAKYEIQWSEPAGRYLKILFHGASDPEPAGAGTHQIQSGIELARVEICWLESL